MSLLNHGYLRASQATHRLVLKDPFVLLSFRGARGPLFARGSSRELVSRSWLATTSSTTSTA